MDDGLKDEITTYLSEIKADIENYLTWAMNEVSSSDTTNRAAEIVEDTMYRLMTISFYLATFFDNAEPSHVLYDLASEISEDQGKEPAVDQGRIPNSDLFNRTRH